MSKLKVSVVGTGHLGTIHTKLWQNNPNINFTGIFDISEERRKVVSEEVGCKAFASFEELLKHSDAVTIATPTSLHFELAMKCIDNGVHCFIEKPIASTYEQAVELISRAKEKGVEIQVGHVERFNPAIAALKGYDLNPLFIESHRLSQFKPRAIDVSVVHDLMIHDIDIILWLIDSPVSKIDANGVAVLTETPDIANARITFQNGAVANLTASRITARPMRKMRIFQKNAYISIDFGKQDVEVFRLDNGNEELNGAVPATMLGSIDLGIQNQKILFEKPIVPQINAIAEEQNSFIDSILNNTPIAVSAEEAAEALRIADKISELINDKGQSVD